MQRSATHINSLFLDYDSLEVQLGVRVCCPRGLERNVQELEEIYRQLRDYRGEKNLQLRTFSPNTCRKIR